MNTETQDPIPKPKPLPPPKPPADLSRRLSELARRLGQAAAGARPRFRWPGARLPWRRVALGVAGVLVLAAVSIPAWHALTGYAKPGLAPARRRQALPVVAVARVTRRDLYNEDTIVAEFRPYVEVELHAKVSGYVREMKVDFGDRVKAGQILATLEVPELLDELNNAIATEQKAEADYTNAHLIYMRLAAVNRQHPNLVAQQDLDTAEAKDRTTAAAIAAAKAEVAKYNTLVDYTRITAPFDGVITKRYADPGALIQAGTTSETQSLPLVRVSDNYRLRLDFPVSLPYVKDTHVGDRVDVRVESLGGKRFTGVITRTTERVEEETRTMTTEIEVPNPNLKLVPGMYATAVLKVARRPHALAIPPEAISTENGTNVYVLNRRQEIEERPVTLGLETPGEYEVLAGLKEGDLVMISSRSLVKPGQKVKPRLITSLAQQ